MEILHRIAKVLPNFLVSWDSQCANDFIWIIEKVFFICNIFHRTVNFLLVGVRKNLHSIKVALCFSCLGRERRRMIFDICIKLKIRQFSNGLSTISKYEKDFVLRHEIITSLIHVKSNNVNIFRLEFGY